MQNEKVPAAMQDNVTQAAENTDREIWREREGDYYADSIHVTQQGGIGINCGGHVIQMPVRDWHRLASTTAQTEAVQTLVEALEKAVAFYDNLSRPHDEGEAKLLDEMVAALAAHRESQP